MLSKLHLAPNRITEILQMGVEGSYRRRRRVERKLKRKGFPLERR